MDLQSRTNSAVRDTLLETLGNLGIPTDTLRCRLIMLAADGNVERRPDNNRIIAACAAANPWSWPSDKMSLWCSGRTNSSPFKKVLLRRSQAGFSFWKSLGNIKSPRRRYLQCFLPWTEQTCPRPASSSLLTARPAVISCPEVRGDVD